MIPGGALGTVIGALLIQRQIEMLSDLSVFTMPLMLGMWGVFGLIGSAVWRLPRYWFIGPVRTPAIARFVSGVMLLFSCIFVLHVGRSGAIDLPEPAMGISMVSMLLACVIGCVEFEAWYGRQVQ